MVVERAIERAQRRVNVAGSYEITRRSRGSDRLAVILAGYKPHLWDLTLARFERFLPEDMDVCVLSAARRVPELEDLARRRGWSYLTTKRNYVSLVQNLAIQEHPDARFIFKFDEDILLTSGVCETLLDTYRRVQDERSYDPGFVAPVLNVNGFSYVRFLQKRGLADEYEARFGPLVHAGGQIPATDDGAAARWLWEHSLPFDDVGRAVAEGAFGYSVVPHKFNIGAVMFERWFWERIRGFPVRPPAGALGVDESYLCMQCIQLSRVMVVAHNAFAGHFAFGPQETSMREALPALRTHLRAPAP